MFVLSAFFCCCAENKSELFACSFEAFSSFSLCVVSIIPFLVLCPLTNPSSVTINLVMGSFSFLWHFFFVSAWASSPLHNQCQGAQRLCWWDGDWVFVFVVKCCKLFERKGESRVGRGQKVHIFCNTRHHQSNCKPPKIEEEDEEEEEDEDTIGMVVVVVVVARAWATAATSSSAGAVTWSASALIALATCSLASALVAAAWAATASVVASVSAPEEAGDSCCGGERCIEAVEVGRVVDETIRDRELKMSSVIS
jgi:hypothetical protein